MPNNKLKIKNEKLKIETKETVRKKSVKAQSKTTAKPATVRGSISAPMYNVRGAKNGSLALPKEVFGVKINQPLMAQAVRVYLANQRQGNASTKSRGDISLTTAKWYRQKGTGRARHGAKSAPIFVGGGVAHGPKPKDYSLNLPQKMKKAALYSALSLKAKDGEIKILSGLSKITPKSKEMFALIQKVTEDKEYKAKVLLVTSANPKELESVYRAGRNLKNMEILNAKLLNTYEVLKYKNLIFMKESIEVLAASTSNVAQANAVKRS